jgi:hypothetical protein
VYLSHTRVSITHSITTALFANLNSPFPDELLRSDSVIGIFVSVEKGRNNQEAENVRAKPPPAHGPFFLFVLALPPP